MRDESGKVGLECDLKHTRFLTKLVILTHKCVQFCTQNAEEICAVFVGIYGKSQVLRGDAGLKRPAANVEIYEVRIAKNR